MSFLVPASLNPFLLGGVRSYVRNFWARQTRFPWPAQKAQAQRLGHKKTFYAREHGVRRRPSEFRRLRVDSFEARSSHPTGRQIIYKRILTGSYYRTEY